MLAEEPETKAPFTALPDKEAALLFITDPTDNVSRTNAAVPAALITEAVAGV